MRARVLIDRGAVRLQSPPNFSEAPVPWNFVSQLLLVDDARKPLVNFRIRLQSSRDAVLAARSAEFSHSPRISVGPYTERNVGMK